MFYAKHFITLGLYVSCPGLSPAISAQFTLKMCVAARNHENFTIIPNFGDSRSFKVIYADKIKRPVTSACYNKQHACTYVQSLLRAIAECFARLSCGLGARPSVCLSVRPSHCCTVSKPCKLG